MREKELIEVYIRTEAGKTVCICERSHKMCDKKCECDIVERDRFRGWQDVMRVNKYGK